MAETRAGVAETKTGVAEVAEMAENRRAPTPRQGRQPPTPRSAPCEDPSICLPALINQTRSFMGLAGGEHGALHVGRPRGDRLCDGRGGRTGQRYEVRETDGHRNSGIAFCSYPFPRTYQGPETHLAACHSHTHTPKAIANIGKICRALNPLLYSYYLLM